MTDLSITAKIIEQITLKRDSAHEAHLIALSEQRDLLRTFQVQESISAAYLDLALDDHPEVDELQAAAASAALFSWQEYTTSLERLRIASGLANAYGAALEAATAANESAPVVTN